MEVSRRSPFTKPLTGKVVCRKTTDIRDNNGESSCGLEVGFPSYDVGTHNEYQ